MQDIVGQGTLYASACKDIDAILKQLNTTAQEGLNSNFLGRFFVSIVDTFGGICKTFVSNFANISKSIKRSELHEFVSSNSLKVRVVDNIPYQRLIGFQVDVPANLQGTYKHAIANIAQIYIKLNTLNTSKIIDHSFTNIFNSLVNADTKTAELIKTCGKVIFATTGSVKPVVLECQRNFSGKFQEKIKFDALFTSKEEFSECKNMLIDLEPRLQEAAEINKNVQNIESTLKDICQHVNDNTTNLTQNDLVSFGEMIKSAALIMDGYQLAVTRQLALEHNYILMINGIYYNVK